MTLVFYEAPHRIEKMLKNCLEVFGDREMCLARELTKRHEEFLRGTISEIINEASKRKGEMVVVIAGHEEEKDIDVTQGHAAIERTYPELHQRRHDHQRGNQTRCQRTRHVQKRNLQRIPWIKLKSLNNQAFFVSKSELKVVYEEKRILFAQFFSK